MKQALQELLRTACLPVNYAGTRFLFTADDDCVVGTLSQGLQWVGELNRLTVGVSINSRMDGQQISGLSFQDGDDEDGWTLRFADDSYNLSGDFSILKPNGTIGYDWLEGVLSESGLPAPGNLIGSLVSFTSREDHRYSEKNLTLHSIEGAIVTGFMFNEEDEELILSISVRCDEDGKRIAGIGYIDDEWKIVYEDENTTSGHIELVPTAGHPASAPTHAQSAHPAGPAQAIHAEATVRESPFNSASSATKRVEDEPQSPVAQSAPADVAAAPVAQPVAVPEQVVKVVRVLERDEPEEVESDPVRCGKTFRVEEVPVDVIFQPIYNSFGAVKRYRKRAEDGVIIPVTPDGSSTNGWKDGYGVTPASEIGDKDLVLITEAL